MVRPKYAVVSAGEDNPFGHPHALTVELLQMAGVRVFVTAKAGTVVFESDGEL